VGSDAEGSAFVGGGDEAEEQLGTGVVERGEAEFVEDDQVVAQQAVDHLAHAAISQTAVEGVDQVAGAVVADSVSGVDGGRSEREKQMAFAGPGWPDEADILSCSDPFEAAEVVEGGPRDWRGGQVELVQRRADREAGLPPAMISRSLPRTKPAIATAVPVNELSREMTTGMSAPPMGSVIVTPKMSAAARMRNMTGTLRLPAHGRPRCEWGRGCAT
jgi:hypothetical protein